MKKWGLIARALAITAVFVAVRLAIDLAGYDVITPTTLVTAFIGGAIFTVAIIFTGTLADYKESERIPNEIAVALLALHQDSRLFRPEDNPAPSRLREHVRALGDIITGSFRSGTFDNGAVRREIARINEVLCQLADESAPPQYVLTIRTGLGTIDRLMSRVKTIAETQFIPAAYAIAEISVVGVTFLLLFVRLDPWYEAIVIFTIINALLISILLLIRDMDNPFEHGKKTFADVDISPVEEVGQYLD